MACRNKGLSRRGAGGGAGLVAALVPFLIVGSICATPKFVRAQSITGPEAQKAPTDPTEVLQMLRERWGVDAWDDTDEEPARPIVDDELKDEVAHPAAPVEALIAELQQAVKLLNLGHLTVEQRIAAKKAERLAESQIRAAVEDARQPLRTRLGVKRALRMAFSDYLATLEALVGLP